MTCKDAMRKLCGYLDGNLAPALAQQLTRHLSRCEDCRQVVGTARETLEAYFPGQLKPVAQRKSQAA